MKFEYNSWKLEYKKPFGAVKKSEEIMFYVESDAEKVFLLGFNEKVEMKKRDSGFFALITPSFDCGLVFYSFEAIIGDSTFIYGQSTDGGTCKKNGKPYQLTVHNNSETPKWFKNKVMYQIYVDRFFKGDTKETILRENILMHSSWGDKPVYIKNEKGEIVIWDFFGGNLDGIIKKLDYIKKIGVDIIYLNPIFESSSNHKYDTADYSKIDGMYGDEEVLKQLVKKAKARGMRIMLDGVFSHTGDDSIYFNKYKNYGDGGAFNDKNSEYYEWYDFESYPTKYDSWWGITALPCVKELTTSYIDYLLNEDNGAVIKWMRAGISGWRLDVADELQDEFIKKLIEAIIKVNPEAVLLGEVWEDASNKISYDTHRKYIIEDSMNSISNYPLRDSLIELLMGSMGVDEFSTKIMKLQENYPKDIFMSLMNMTGTHDTTRLATLLGGAPGPDEMNTWQKRDYELSDEKKELAKKRLELFLLVIYTMPGNPCIYYGDEICLEGYKDPYNRGTYDWDTTNSDTIEYISKLTSLRGDIISDDIFLNFDRNGECLIYSLISQKATFTAFMNQNDTDIEIDLNNRVIKFMHNADELSDKMIIKPYGALVVKEN